MNPIPETKKAVLLTGGVSARKVAFSDMHSSDSLVAGDSCH